MIADKDAKMTNFVENILVKRLKSLPNVMNLIKNDIYKQWPEEMEPSTI